MRNNVNFWLGNLAQLGILVVTLSTLFLFWGETTDFYEIPKFLVLFGAVAILFLILSIKFVFQDKVTILRTPLDLPLLLLLVVATVSTIASPAPMISIFGHQPTLNSGLASLVVYVLFYLFLVNSLTGSRDVKFILHLLSICGLILSALTLLAFFGVKLVPAPFVQGANFTPTGGSFSTAAILSLLLPYSLLSILTSENRISSQAANSLHVILLSLFGITILLIGTWGNWVAAAAAVILVLITTPVTYTVRKLPFLILPALLIIAVAIFTYAPLPGKVNPFHSLAANFPREPQLPFITSWKISVSAFRDSPFWGQGPDSYLYSFTTYKPLDYNQTKFWNIRFDQPFNEYLGVLANLGGLGFVALILATLLFLYYALPLLGAKNRFTSRVPEGTTIGGDIIGSDTWIKVDRMFGNSDEALKVALAISGVVLFLSLSLHPATMALWVIGLIMLAAFMAISTNITKPMTLRFGSTSSDPSQLTLDILPSIILLALLALLIFGSFNLAKHVMADMNRRQALNAVAKNQGVEAYNKLVAAEKLSPWNDLYHSDLAQINYALAAGTAQSKGPTSDNPQGSLSDQDKTNIQALLQQSISEGRTATTANPRNVANWEVLAAVYRQISGVAQNALVFSLDSYGRAIQKDPYNPILRLNVGGVYYSIKNYELAVRFFTDAVNLKPDWPNAYYNLAVALRDKGDLNTAKAVAQKTVELINPKDESNQDFKTATNLVNELDKATLTPPAAPGSGTLEKEQSKVLNLPKPENISTPSAVKK